jgi:mannosyltransferase
VASATLVERRSGAAPARPGLASNASAWSNGWLLVGLVAAGAVLRVLRLGANGMTFDESFTAMAARRPFGDLLTFLRTHDSHPPLDYLLRAPFARLGSSDVVLRAPSVAFSIAALVLFAWWMRDRGRLGVIATGVMALSVFQLRYGSEARMYSLLLLIGVAAALTAERWLREPRARHAVVAGILLFVALLDHSSAFLLFAGLLALAGVRHDRAAWQWRGALGAAFVVWLPLWGPSFLEQLDTPHASWIPATSLSGFSDAVARQLSSTRAVAPVVLLAVIAGGFVLLRRDRVLGRVWIACAALPFVLAAAIGIFTPFLLDRTLTLAAWAPVIAIAALVDAAFRRWNALGVVAMIAVGLVVVFASYNLFTEPWEHDVAVSHLEAAVGPGDVVAVDPFWYAPLLEWRLVVRGPGHTTRVTIPGLLRTETIAIGTGKPSGRVWLFELAYLHEDIGGRARCAPTWTDGTTRILCFRATAR